MNRRRWIICLGILALGLLVLGVLIYRPWDRGPIRFENVEKIQVGMTTAEVVALIGCESGNHSTGPVHVRMLLPDGSFSFEPIPMRDEHIKAGRVAGDGAETWIWVGDRGFVAVTFDGAMKVIHKEAMRGRRSVPPAWWLFLERKLGFDP